jgi:hypothetical protein
MCIGVRACLVDAEVVRRGYRGPVTCGFVHGGGRVCAVEGRVVYKSESGP